MSYIRNLINDVNKTHPHLGELVAMCQIVVKAHKMMFLVSPTGCGKSRAMSIIGQYTPNSMSPDKISTAGLAELEQELTSFRSVFIIDDITTTQTEYARRATIITLAALCYSHHIQSEMAGCRYEITDFYGSALVGIQPLMLKDLMLADEWDTSIQDKTIRYYYMYRPLEPVIDYPLAQIEYGRNNEIRNFEPDKSNPNWEKLISLGLSQWGLARTIEHVSDMLKAIASLEERKEVIDNDYELLLTLLKPIAIENVVLEKLQLEGEQYLDNNLLALLTEYYTYGGKFSLAHVARDFRRSVQQAYKIMGSQNGYWQQISKSPTIYKPSKYLLDMLKLYNLEIKENEN